MRGRIKKNIIISIFAGVIAFAILEAFLRIAFGFGNPLLFEPSDEYGYRIAPNQNIYRFGKRIFINEQGLRSEPMTAIPKKGVERILCAGDSITNGGILTDQEDTYPYILQKLLNKAGDRRFEILNASAPGWASRDEEAFLKKFGIYNSKIVILQVHSTDFFQPRADKNDVGQNSLYPRRRPLLALQDLLFTYGKKFSRKMTGIAPIKKQAEVDVHITVRAEVENIKRIVDLVRSQGAKPIVMYVERPRDRRQEIYIYCRKMLSEGLAGINVPFIDMSDKLWQAGGQSLFCADGTHPNPEGNALMARFAAESVKEIY
jgi:lysophospholipase L1-like esterase